MTKGGEGDSVAHFLTSKANDLITSSIKNLCTYNKNLLGNTYKFIVLREDLSPSLFYFPGRGDAKKKV